MAELVLIPKISIHPDRICFFNEVNWIGLRTRSVDQETGESFKQIKYDHLLNSKRSAEGKVSDIARRKMSKALDYLLLMSNDKKVQSRHTGRHIQFKIAFITLTLPSKQMHPDSEIKSKCLNQFLLEIKKHYQVLNYIWRAEKQKNGNLHFHIIVDKFIPWSELRDRWNRICNKLGYVDRYREELKKFHSNGFQVRKDLLNKWSYKDQVKAYEKGKANDWNSPNSTDVHSVRKIINIKAYIAKYLTKNNEVNEETGEIDNEIDKVTGRLWGCNKNLSNIKGARMVLDNETSDQLKQAIDSSNCRQYHGAYFSVFFLNFETLPKFGATEIFSEFCRYLVDHFDYSYQPYFSK